MSSSVADSVLRGTRNLVLAAKASIDEAVSALGPDASLPSTGTIYHLPISYALTGEELDRLAELALPVTRAASHLPDHLPPAHDLSLFASAGLAAMLAGEALLAASRAQGVGAGEVGGPIEDVVLRAWGIQMADGRIPGFAVLIGSAPSTAVVERVVRELQARGIVVFLCGNGQQGGAPSLLSQVREAGIELGLDNLTVPLGSEVLHAVYALDFAARAAMSFGAVPPGQQEAILSYCKNRVKAFVLAMGPLDEASLAVGAAALTMGFPVISDQVLPDLFPGAKLSVEGLISQPWTDGEDELAQASKLVARCLEARGIKIKIATIDIPVAYGSAFEGERVRKENMRAEFGGQRTPCFELLSMASRDDIEDGLVAVHGADIPDIPMGGALPLAIQVRVFGGKMQPDFEPVLERQIHHFINGAEGIQHIGQRDITWIRVSKIAAEKGFRLEHIGRIIHAMLHDRFAEIVDKVRVDLYTDEGDVLRMRQEAREIYRQRNERAAALTDEAVDTFYSCALCQSFAPNHICVINPERIGLCGAYSWFDCKASAEINPTGPNRPIAKADPVDLALGEWQSVNDFVQRASNGTVERITLYSMMDAPMTACGCFECITIVVPEANGVLVVSREDPAMTPAGMTFSTLAGMIGGGVQTPGIMGHGKYFLTSKKYLFAEGGFKRVVWLSSNVKEQMAEELAEVARREGFPDLLESIADAGSARSLEDLLSFLEKNAHPALGMDPII